jgi:hypothetical protein
MATKTDSNRSAQRFGYLQTHRALKERLTTNSPIMEMDSNVDKLHHSLSPAASRNSCEGLGGKQRLYCRAEEHK